MKMTTLGLVRGRLFHISVAALLRASASALKLVEYFPVAMLICTIPSLYLMYMHPPPSQVAPAAEPLPAVEGQRKVEDPGRGLLPAVEGHTLE